MSCAIYSILVLSRIIDFRWIPPFHYFDMDLYAHNFSPSIYLTGHLIGVVRTSGQDFVMRSVSDIEQDMTFYEKCRKELVTHVYRRIL